MLVGCCHVSLMISGSLRFSLNPATFHELYLVYYNDGAGCPNCCGCHHPGIVIALNARDFPRGESRKCRPQPSSLTPAECPSSQRARSQGSAACLSRQPNRQFGRLPNFLPKYPFGRSCLNSQNARASSAKASVLSKA